MKNDDLRLICWAFRVYKQELFKLEIENWPHNLFIIVILVCALIIFSTSKKIPSITKMLDLANTNEIGYFNLKDILQNELIYFEDRLNSNINLLIIIGLCLTSLFLVINIEEMQKIAKEGYSGLIEFAPRAFIATFFALFSAVVISFIGKWTINKLERLSFEITNNITRIKSSLEIQAFKSLEDGVREFSRKLLDFTGSAEEAMKSLNKSSSDLSKTTHELVERIANQWENKSTELIDKILNRLKLDDFNQGVLKLLEKTNDFTIKLSDLTSSCL